jgi:RNA polymerase sigma-70 factor, ECF subfamily
LQTATATAMAAEAPILSPFGALEQLFRDHHRLVFRTAYRVTGNPSDAEDVLQTVFMRLAGRDPAALPVENQDSYLRRAAVNAALDIARHRARSREDASDEPLPEPGQTEPDRQELRDCLRQALARLSPREAEVFALRFIEGYGNTEIARMLELSRVSVAVIVHRARHRLQQEIRSYLGGSHEQR